MAALSEILRESGDGRLGYRCPACDEFHVINTDPRASGPRWTWNGDPVRPTFAPAIRVRSIRRGLTGDDAELLEDTLAQPGGKDMAMHDPRLSFVCHHFVVAGQLRFQKDCTHGMAGKTVDIPPWKRER